MLALQIIIVDFIIETNTADCMQVNDSISWCNLFLTLLTQQCNFDSISNNLFCHHLFCYHFSVHLTVYLHKIYEHHHNVQNVFQFWFFMHCFLCVFMKCFDNFCRFVTAIEMIFLCNLWTTSYCDYSHVTRFTTLQQSQHKITYELLAI